MFHYQLKNGKEWTTQNTVTTEVADKIRKLMTDRGRVHMTHYRLVDLEKVGPKKAATQPRASRKRATPAAKPATETVEV